MYHIVAQFLYAARSMKNRTGITQAERQYAQYLVDMINSVDAEGAKSMNDLANDAFKELARRSMKQ